MKSLSPRPTKNPIRRAVLLCATAFILFTGCQGLTQRAGSHRLSEAEQMMWSTYLIGTRTGAGSAIAVSMPVAGGGKEIALVTSAHLLETTRKGPVFIALRVPDAAGDPVTAILNYQPPNSSGRFYARHPHHDVAAFSLRISPDIAKYITFPTFIKFEELERGEPVLHAGDEVFFAGFPEGMPYVPGVFPFLRSGRIASYPVGTPAVNDMFCIDADTYAGDSGAPVFPVRGRRPRLAGMIVQRVVGESPGGSHLAVAVHARAIRQTLELLAAMDRRVEGSTGARR